MATATAAAEPIEQEQDKRRQAVEEIERLREAKLETLRRLIIGHRDPETGEVIEYSSMYLAVKTMATEVLGLEWSAGHDRVCRHLTSGERRSAFIYRGAGKSWTWTVPRLLVEIVRDSEARVLICGRTDVIAEGFSAMAKTTVEQNQMFIDLFGRLAGRKKWTTKAWTISTREGNYIEPTVQCVGVGGSVVSRHYTLHLLDDLVDDKNSQTEGQRERMMIWYDMALDPTREPGAPEMVVGTRYHPRDLYTKIEEEQEEGSALALPCLSEEEWGEDQVPWPERHTIEFFEDKRSKVHPNVWAGQWMQNTDLMTGNIIKKKWLKYFAKGDSPTSIKARLMTCDFSATEKDIKGRSYFALIVMDIDGDGEGWVVHAERDHLPFDDQRDRILDARESFGPNWIGLEGVNAQAWMGQHLRDSHDVNNIIGCTPMGRDKITRVTVEVSPFVKQRKLHIRKDLYGLIEELVMFPDGENDDYVDCIAYAVEMATQMTITAGSSVPAGMSADLDEFMRRGRAEPGILEEEF